MSGVGSLGLPGLFRKYPLEGLGSGFRELGFTRAI